MGGITTNIGSRPYTTEGIWMSTLPFRAAPGNRARHDARRTSRYNRRPGTGKRIERQLQKGRSSGKRHEAFTAVIAAAVLAYIPFHKPLPALGNRFVKYVLMPSSQVKVDDEEPIWMGLRPLIPIESRLPRAREDPCSFRTRLIDPLAGSDFDVALESSGMLSSGDLRFDDTQCVSIGRGRECQGWPSIRKTLNDHTTAPCASPNNDDGETDVNMETMNMPFWDLPRRPKRLASRPGDAIPDDMSIISDASLIPTYYPSDIMKQQQQQQQRPRQRARLIKRLIRAKARAARQTVRELRRSCRDAVEHVFVEPTAAAAVHKGTKCLAVGSMY
ncbi:hypothetical protein P885DRAFT_30162 [Corynascus similis CBS 632.67]